ncbi:zinc finger protein 511 [Caerostris extrusa]|uniref:Zinc finger protein 511 n=1 Tax=Caerostris extrusa TaxID=172846 RepID=A0AAV4TMK8_CAEEX|nr:zinc finger protein 511 [Caerostris extrusa]
MNPITTISDFAELFKIPFEPKKVIYSLNSDFFRKGNEICETNCLQFAIEPDDEFIHTVPEFPCGERGCRSTFTNIRDYDVHFKSVHNLVCSTCKQNFPTYNMLDIHIEEKHDSYHEAAKAKNKAKFECFVEGCGQSYPSSDARDMHVINDHNFPPSFKYHCLKKTTGKSEAMDVTEEAKFSKSNAHSNSRRKPYVPSNVCFGRGSSRTFSKKVRKPNKEISMKELGDAL